MNVPRCAHPCCATAPPKEEILFLSEIGAILPKWNYSAEFLSKLFITLVSNVSVVSVENLFAVQV